MELQAYLTSTINLFKEIFILKNVEFENVNIENIVKFSCLFLFLKMQNCSFKVMLNIHTDMAVQVFNSQNTEHYHSNNCLYAIDLINMSLLNFGISTN